MGFQCIVYQYTYYHEIRVCKNVLSENGVKKLRESLIGIAGISRGTWWFTMQIMWVLFPPGWHGAVHGMNTAWETIAVCQARQFARRKRTAVPGSFVNRFFFGTRSWPATCFSRQIQKRCRWINTKRRVRIRYKDIYHWCVTEIHPNPKSKVLLITANFLDFRWVDFTSSTLLLFKSSLECKYIQMVYHVMGPCLELPFVE